MNREIWDQYNPSEICDAIIYWGDIWDDLCNSIEGTSIERLRRNSAHLALLGVRDEVNEQGFTHPELITLFKKR
jgi:hypothetical protein